MTLFCMVSTLLRADTSPENRLVGEGETTVTESASREVPGKSDKVGKRACVSGHWVGFNRTALSTPKYFVTLTTRELNSKCNYYYTVMSNCLMITIIMINFWHYATEC